MIYLYLSEYTTDWQLKQLTIPKSNTYSGCKQLIRLNIFFKQGKYLCTTKNDGAFFLHSLDLHHHGATTRGGIWSPPQMFSTGGGPSSFSCSPLTFMSCSVPLPWSTSGLLLLGHPQTHNFWHPIM